MSKRIVVLVVLMLAAQRLGAGTNGTVEGTVRDARTGETLPGATVQLLGTRIGSSTDPTGFYRIQNVPAGVYDVRCALVGYRTVVVRNVRVTADLKARLDHALSAADVEMGPVEIVAERPPLQKDVTGTVHTSGSESFEVLPVATVSDVAALKPGITLDNNIRGGKTNETAYLVDGLPAQNLIDGGAGATLPQSSVSDMAIQTGGWDPEYGNALSGVINVMTRRGGEEHLFALRAEKDDLFGGEQVDHRNELDLSAGGPITDGVSYFASGSGLWTDTRWWQDMERFFESPVATAYNGFGRIDAQLSDPLRLTVQALFSTASFRDYEFSWRFNLIGLPDRERTAYRLAAILSHTVSPEFFYVASVSLHRLDDAIDTGPLAEVDTSMYQWDFFLQYVVDGSRAWWARNTQMVTLLKADATWRLDDVNLLKAGGTLDLMQVRSEVTRYEPVLNVYGKPFVNKPLLNYSTDYSYFPRQGSLYLQDRLELSKDGMLLNIGFRYEFLDPRAERPVAERVPGSGGEYETEITGTVPASVKHLFSPRIGFAAPYAERGYLFINYGVYYQFPLFDYLYSGLNNVSLQKGVGVLIGNPDLQPERTRAWEVSLKYALPNGVVLSGTYFNKETTNLIDVKTFVPTNANVAGDYGFAEFVNNPYAFSSGIEVMVSREQSGTVTGSVSYTYMTAEGLSVDARQGLAFYQWGIPVPAVPFPLSWDQRHMVKLVGSVRLPLDLTLSAAWTFATGKPYTYYPSSDGFTPDDPSMEFEPNNARLPEYNLLNMKLSWLLPLSAGDMRGPKVVVYLDGRNILNSKNARWADSSGRIGGELGDLSAYDPGRRVRLGVRAEL